MKKILIIMPSMFIGGAERSLLGLLEAFDYDQYQVDLFLYRHEGELLQYIPEEVNVLPENEYYKVFDVSIKSLLFSKKIIYGIARICSKVALHIHSALKKEPAGIWMNMQYTSKFLQPFLPKIKGHYDLGIMFLGIADTLINKVDSDMKITWNHTDYDTLGPDKKMDLETYSKVDYVVSVSDECTQKVIKHYPELKEKAITIENLLAKDFIIKQSKEKIENPFDLNTDFNLLSIGRYCEAKNFDNVPFICKKLLDLGLNIKWYIIGYGGDEEKIVQNIKKNHMEDYVILLGKKTNPYPYIKACDVYVQPSRYEGKCVSVREAQILNKPVIITNYATAKNQLVNGYDGMIVPLENEKCALGIYNVLANKDLLHTISENTYKSDYSNYDSINDLINLIND
nr:glycosyltransferase [Catenibacterium mitsuokai]